MLTRRRFLQQVGAVSFVAGVGLPLADQGWLSLAQAIEAHRVCLHCPHLVREHVHAWQFSNRLYWWPNAVGERQSCYVLCLQAACPDFQRWQAWDAGQRRLQRTLTRLNARAPRPPIQRQSAEQLRGLLSANPNGLPEELVAALLWPGVPAKRALLNLHAAVFALRHNLGRADAVQRTKAVLRLRPEFVRQAASNSA
jgi:hypothetical protein